MVGCYDAVSKRLQRLGPVATHILPACTPILACQGLNSNQFDMVVGIVQGMMQAVISYRKNEIANPKAYAIDLTQPTHPGGVPDEQEIMRQRNAALGTWKPAPAASAKAASQPLTASGFPASPSSSAPAGKGSAPGGFDMDSIFSALPAPAVSVGSPSPSSGVLTPTRAANPILAPVSMGGSIGGRGGESFGGMDMFQGLSIPQQKAAGSNEKPAGSLNGSTDPFASAGLAEAFGAPSRVERINSGSAAGGMPWMSDAYGDGGGTGMGSPRYNTQTNRPTTSPSFGGLGGVKPMQVSAPLAMGGIPPPQPPAPTPTSLPSGGATGGGDPFAAFFDATISGGAGARGDAGLASSSSSTIAGSAFSGGYGAVSSRSCGASPSPGYGAAAMGGTVTGAGSGTLEDQLANTQREIAQLTEQLTNGARVGMMGAQSMAALAMGQIGGGPWGMPGTPAGFGGNVGNIGTQQGWHNGGGASSSAQTGQEHNASQDPFAFLDSKSNSSSGGQQHSGQGGGGSGFGFLGRF